MATKNAINSSDPIEVAAGGTGAATLTDHGVIVGSGTGAVTALAVGATGTLLVGATTADPAFGTSATGDFTFTSSTASQTRVLTVINDDNTAVATSAARVDITTGGANVADPQVSYIVTSATTWSTGIDNNDSDEFKLSANAALGTTDVLTATTAGEINMPLQPAFLAVVGSDDTDVTGNGTVYSYVADTEIFDQNSDYNNSTGVFTAPVTGRYMITATSRLSDAVAATNIIMGLTGSNRSFTTIQARAASGSDLADEIIGYLDMDAADTVFPTVRVNGEASDRCDLLGTSGSIEYSTFSGYLVC